MSRRDADMDEEMREHLRQLAEHHVAAGMTPEDARRAGRTSRGH
jgi:hypothetical protein